MRRQGPDSLERGAVANQIGPAGGLSVVGEAIRSVVPDAVELRLGVETQGVNAAQALKDNGKKVVQIVNALVKIGIPEKDVSNSGLTANAIYDPTTLQPQFAQSEMQRTEGRALIIGQCVRSALKVTVHDTTRAGEILDVGIKAGANFNVGLWFTIRDASAVRRDALASAGKDARAKAEVLATALGSKLGSPFAIVEDVFFPNLAPAGPIVPAMQPGNIAGGSGLGTGLPYMAGVSNDAIPVALQFGARVHVTYGLR